MMFTVIRMLRSNSVIAKGTSMAGRIVDIRTLSTKKSDNPFYTLVQGLKNRNQKIAVVESCCGGLINASIMQIPGSSAVYYGGTVAYNTKQSLKLLLNDSILHDKLRAASSKSTSSSPTSPAESYINSKMIWTEECAKAFCEALDVDYCVAEGGASGPTFRPSDLHTGFAVIAIAGRRTPSSVELLAQTVIRSDHANRIENMKLFSNAAAELAVQTIGIDGKNDDQAVSQDSATTSPSSSIDASLWLDRATHLRTDESALQALESHPDAKCVLLKNSNECLMTTTTTELSSDSTTSNVSLALLPLSSIVEMVASSSEFPLPKSFLGLDPNGSPIYVVDVNTDTNQDIIESILQTPEKALSTSNHGSTTLNSGMMGFENTRTHAPLLLAHENELVLYATALSQWKKTHKFCSSCGHELYPIEGGTCLVSSVDDGGCGTKWWPRQDPSIIVLVTNRDGTKALLARSPRHPEKMHTAIAGFVEAGEQMEQAVMREVYEETGIRVDPESITYLSSQPWPFPRSCMLAFRATADEKNQQICIDEEELTSASWFDKDEVELATRVPGAVMNKDVAAKALEDHPNLTVLVPPTGVVARTLIDDWLDDL